MFGEDEMEPLHTKDGQKWIPTQEELDMEFYVPFRVAILGTDLTADVVEEGMLVSYESVGGAK